MLYIITIDFSPSVVWVIPSYIIEPCSGKENNL